MRMIKTWAVVAALLLAAAVAWRYRNADFVRQLTHGQPPAAVQIPFDNGTVRQYERARPEAGRDAPAAAAAGGIRKCRRGAEIIYTGDACPPGARELPMNGGTLSVVAGQKAPATPPQRSGEPGERRSTLQDVLDRSGDLDVTNRRIERATNP